MKNPVHPGVLVREDCVKELGLTVTAAAERLGISRQTLSNLINEKIALTHEMAQKLERAGWGKSDVWIQKQVDYDLALAGSVSSEFSKAERTVITSIPYPSLVSIAETGWQAAIENRSGYQELIEAFYYLEKKCVQYSQTAISIQWLRALCSLSFSRRLHIDEPFVPFVEGAASMDSFADENILQFLVDVMDSSFENNFLRARLGDILWSLKKPKNRAHLIQCVDCYMQAPLHYDVSWHHLHEACWERAIIICNAATAAVGNRREVIEERLYQHITDSSDDVYWKQLLAKLVLNSLPILKDKSSELGDIFKNHGLLLFSTKKFHLAQSCFEIAGGFFSRAKDNDACISVTVLIADSFLAEGEEIYKKDHNGRFFQAADRFDRAIQFYLSIPQSERAQYKISSKIRGAKKLHKECNVESLKLMPSHTIDHNVIEDMQWVVDEAIQEDNPLESLKGLTYLTFPVNLGDLKQEVLEKENTRNLSSFMTGPLIHLESDGRVSERVAGFDFLSDEVDRDSKEYAEWSLHEQLMSYQQKVEFTTVSCIQFVWRRLRETHRFSERYFIELASNSSFVPKNRIRIVAKGLYQGYKGEFGISMHLLAPQLEGIVRHHLHEAGVDSNHIPTKKKGVQHVTGLSALIENHRALCECIYSPETTFEIDALFCQSATANLRNDVAHGLLDDYSGDNTFTMYAWVFVLKLVMSPFSNIERSKKALEL